jgi:hypothetical chaperone protein
MTRPVSFGFDFGTTNSAVALARADGSTEMATFPSAAGPRQLCRSILYFERAAGATGERPRLHVGPDAIARYLTAGGQGRLMQSLKSFLASRHMHSTSVFGHSYTLSQLVAAVLRELRLAAERAAGPIDGPVVVGRPVTFAWSDGPEDDAFAESRLREALGLAGFGEVVFELEPVAAAAHYEAGLDHDELVMVADLGGGTSDFCLLHVGPGARSRGGARILGTDGIGVGGDVFDACIVRERVSPALGRGGEHRSHLGKVLPNPAWLYTHLSRWHLLSMLKTPETRELLEGLERQALEPGRIARLHALVEHDLGYALYAAVESAKVRLSAEGDTTFSLETEHLAMQAPLARAELESWISPDLRSVSERIDALLRRTGAAPADVDRVFVTGGSGLVPAVQELLGGKFGRDRLTSGDYLVSVARGLAIRARDLDA